MHEDHTNLSVLDQPPPLLPGDSTSRAPAEPAPTPGDLAVVFLQQVDPVGRHHLVAIEPDVGPVASLPSCNATSDAEQIREWVNARDGKCNLHWTVNEPSADFRGLKPSKTDIVAIRAAHLDVDLAGANTEEALQELLRSISERLPPDLSPSAMINSGGGYQLLFKLSEKIATTDGREALEAQNRGLIALFDGDASTWNLDRLLRLPGAMNVPDRKKQAKGRMPKQAKCLMGKGTEYSLPTLAKFVPPREQVPQVDRNPRVREVMQVLENAHYQSLSTLDDIDPELRARLEADLNVSPKLMQLWQGDFSQTRQNGAGGKRNSFATTLGAHGSDYTVDEFAEIMWVWGVSNFDADYCDQRLNIRQMSKLRERYEEAARNYKPGKSVDPDETSKKWYDGNAVETPAVTGEAKPIRRLALTSFQDAAATALDHSNKPLVQGFLDQGTLSVLYGPSNAGKTFMALDIAFHVATGLPWGGMATTKGTVLYVAAEGGPGARKRARALQKHHRMEHVQVDIEFVLSTINLLDPKADLEPLIATMADLAAVGRPVIFLVIDTFSRAFAGGEENGSTDMGTMVAHFDRIRQATSSHVCIIHHSGKQIAKGARGHSLLRAATDTEIEVVPNHIVVTKQRDLEGNYATDFNLVQVEIGKAPNGAPVSSAVVQLVNRGAGEPGVATPAEQGVMNAIRVVVQSLEPGEQVFRTSDVLGVLEGLGTQISKDGLRKHLSQLVAKRLLRSAGRGQFALGGSERPHSGFFQQLTEDEVTNTISERTGVPIGGSVFD